MEKGTVEIRVLIGGVRQLVVHGIIGLLNGEDGIEVVGQASNRLELVEGVGKFNPDIVILDAYGGSNEIASLESINLINQWAPQIKFLLLVKDYDDDRELAALRMGVRGFLPEGSVGDDLIRCIKAINRGEMWVRRKVAERLIREMLVLINILQGHSVLLPSLIAFSRRELDIMMLVGTGCRNKDIAGRLSISEKTVKYHISRVFRKLNIRKRTEIKGYLKAVI